MITISILYQINRLSLDCIVLAYKNNNMRIDQYLLLQFNDVGLADCYAYQLQIGRYHC